MRPRLLKPNFFRKFICLLCSLLILTETRKHFYDVSQEDKKMTPIAKKCTHLGVDHFVGVSEHYERTSYNALSI